MGVRHRAARRLDRSRPSAGAPVRALGLAPQTRQINRQADEDRLVLDFTLSTNPTMLSAVTVRARQDVPRANERPAPGSVERAINTDQAARLPIDASDLMELALLAPGIVAIPGSDSTSSQFSVGGLGPGANNITLDGLSFGASQVPQEAVRNSRVQTSNFDVSRGQSVASTSTCRTAAKPRASSASKRISDGLSAGCDRIPPRSRAHSSVGQSGGLIIRWSLVRVQVGPPSKGYANRDTSSSMGVVAIAIPTSEKP